MMTSDMIYGSPFLNILNNYRGTNEREEEVDRPTDRLTSSSGECELNEGATAAAAAF